MSLPQRQTADFPEPISVIMFLYFSITVSIFQYYGIYISVLQFLYFIVTVSIFQYYSPSGVFYKLSLSCLEIKHEKYEYTVCPFHSIKHQEFPEPLYYRYYVSIFQYYGPAGVFYKLSLSCLDIKHEKYEYTVCPFHSVKQQAFPSPSKSLGRMARWESTELGDYRLRMYNGDAELCPVGTSRNSLVGASQICWFTIETET